MSLRLAGLLSLGLHAALLAGLLLWFHHAPPSDDAPQTPGAVELVLLEQQGGVATAPPPEPAPPTAVPTPPPPPQIRSPDLPPPDAATADEALPLPPPPVPPPTAPPDVERPASPPMQRAQEAPEINIGGHDDETDAYFIPSPHVIPAGIDAKFRNQEPIYPREAARRAEQGAVILLIHVSPLGLPVGVDIAESSGFALLDRAASDAVWGWHFLPAMLDGRPIAFDMKLRVLFQLD
ncbi:MAG TPA: energy transducer TonB [Acetobacteraceae bacterium]|nr:energy transducer TonB [Acetobacteraceae bacterium]